ncbi:FHY3/FAR1 family protein [Dioscorea alata]|uniref:FHY3/FAR1 family protein n=1 Tax=Dioscorea alata TaxID=55571 RepID=A0ACB7VB96_DIOAL|nr:FHY3/FAR1 family protein [Dioscorea alata]
MEESSPKSKDPKRSRRRILNSKEMDDGCSGDGLDEDLMDGEQGANGGYDGVPEVGMVFQNHQEVTRFYKRYARRVGFGVSVRRSSFTKEGQCLYLELMCCKGGRKRPEPKFRKRTTSTTNCQARIRVKLWGDGMLHLELANLDHNHPVSPSMARFLNCYKQLSGNGKKRGNGDGSENAMVQVNEPSQMPFDRFGGLEELLFGESGFKSFVERGRLKLAEGDAEALRLFFTRMQAKNSNFYNVMDLDEDGCLRNVFWADARSRAAYQYYSDVVALDTTYAINKYDMPLATFVGVNHHGQLVLLGCALLSDETVETYVWLLKAWLACMSGQLPKAIITDHCRSIQRAVAEVFSGVRHRLCLWQIMKKVPEKLGSLPEYRAISKVFQKAVFDSLRVDEFEDDWMRMIEVYGLQGNEWLTLLYDCRHSWAPVYLKDTFWAGMSITQRSDTLTTFFDGYVDTKMPIKQFVGKYEMALQSKYEKEAQADFETFHKRRPAVSKFYMEEQLSKVYTLNMFKKFQDEIEAIMYCHASLLNVDASVSTFDVKECIFLEDGKKTMNKNHTVLYNNVEKDVTCICGSFQFRGILCRHALSVFKSQQVHEIPSQYILDRWKKDFKRLHVAACSSDDVVANNRVDRYDYLSMRCLQLVEVGVISDKYQLALKLIKEVEKFLLSDKTYEDTQPKIVSRVPKAQKVDRNKKSVSAEQNSNENVGPHGALPLQVEYQIPPGMANGANEGYMFQVVPTVPHLRPPEGVKPGAFPYGNHFGMPMNHQPYVANQPGARPGLVYMFPGGVDPKAFGNGPMMPWIYPPHMYQAAQRPVAPTGSRTGLKAKRRRVHGSKLRQASEKPNEPPRIGQSIEKPTELSATAQLAQCSTEPPVVEREAEKNEPLGDGHGVSGIGAVTS